MCMDGCNQICFTSNGVFFISFLACIYNQYVTYYMSTIHSVPYSFLFGWGALSLKRDYHRYCLLYYKDL